LKIGLQSQSRLDRRWPQYLVTASSPTGIQTLLHVDLRGEAKPVFQEPEKYLGWAIPSPDGRHVAIWESSSSSNVWLLEDF
jgi:hypothetical protein